MAIVSSADAGLRAASRATILQLRGPARNARDIERDAGLLVKSSPVPVVISARCDVVLASGAAGVNLPERDIDTRDARTLLGERLVGRSVHTVGGAVAAEADGADYVIFGPVWRSSSHPDVEPAGLQALARVASAVRIPVIAIGGVTAQRIDECHRAGAAGYAAIGAFE